MPFYKTEDIWLKTNGGLDIILHFYPQASKAEGNKNKLFKLRASDKTASTSLKQYDDNGQQVWKIKDFGDDKTLQNGIDIWMAENNVDFPTAIQQIGKYFHVPDSEGTVLKQKAKYEYTKATPEQQPGEISFTVRTENSGQLHWTDFEIETLFAKNALVYAGWYSKKPDAKKMAYSKIAGVLKKYRFFPVSSYYTVRERDVHNFYATDEYPIFVIDEGDFQKLYQPLNPEKKYRFLYIGKKKENYLHGLAQIENEYARRKELQEIAKEEKKQQEANNKGEAIQPLDANSTQSDEVKKIKLKLDEVIIMSGGSDAINAALLDYWVLWNNTETESITPYQYNELRKMTDAIYQLNDIDAAGKKGSHKMAMEFLDIKTIELPEELKKHKDIRGNACNDFRDYLKYYDAYHFKKLVKIALPYRFWDLKPTYEGRGEKRTFVGYKYSFNNKYGYNFLEKNGFYQIEDPAEKTGLSFIHIKGNTVEKIKFNNIKKYIFDFLEDRMEDVDLQNAMFQSPQINENSFSNIKAVEVDFTDADQESQLVFFQNLTIKVTANSIQEFKPGDLPNYAWESAVLKHQFKLSDAPFKITKDDLGEYDIQIFKKDCEFLNFLTQTSRVHWRTELEDKLKTLAPAEQEVYKSVNKFNIAGDLLGPEEIAEQKRHLINKIFTIGYLMHRYKDSSKPWAIFAMDNRLNEDGKSYGGSGKSLIYKTAICDYYLNENLYKYIAGRDPKKLEGDFLYHGVSEHTKVILIDDAGEYFKFDLFFSDITGSINVNPKSGAPFTIPYAKAPKYCFTSNYTLRNPDSSTERRILYSVASDFYHEKGENTDYSETWTPKDDFGHNLFTEWEPKEFNNFYNTLIYCLQFYLGVTEKLGPAMGAVTKRNLFASMGTNFYDWASMFFNEEGANVNQEIIRDHAFKDYIFMTGDNKIKPHGWAEKVKSFCKYRGWVYNPMEMRGKQNNIIRKLPNYNYDARSNTWHELKDAAHKTTEVLYIKTTHGVPDAVNVTIEPNTGVDPFADLDNTPDDIFNN